MMSKAQVHSASCILWPQDGAVPFMQGGGSLQRSACVSTHTGWHQSDDDSLLKSLLGHPHCVRSLRHPPVLCRQRSCAMPKALSCPRTLQRRQWTAACAPLCWKSTSGFRWGIQVCEATLSSLAQPAFQTACLRSSRLPCRMHAISPAQAGQHWGMQEGAAPDRRVCTVQGKTFAGWLARTFPAYRDRLIEDPRFFFKVTSVAQISL